MTQDDDHPQDPDLRRLRAEHERLTRQLDVVRRQVASLRARRAWRLHAALHEARTGPRALALLPVRLVRVLAGPRVVAGGPR